MILLMFLLHTNSCLKLSYFVSIQFKGVARGECRLGLDLLRIIYYLDYLLNLDVDVDVVYGRRRMPLCPPPQYNTSK